MVVTGAGMAMGAESKPAVTVEQRLEQIEKELHSLKDENQSLKQQLGVDGKAGVVTTSGKAKKVSVGLFTHLQAEFGNAPDTRFPTADRFLIRRFRPNITGKFAEDFDFKLEADFGNNSVGSTTGYRAQITDGFVNWNRAEYANIKLGQFKTPFGYEQLVSDTKVLTAERSLPNDRLTLSRQIGVAVSGELLEKRLGYSIGVFNGNGVNNGFNDSEEFAYIGRITGVPLKTKWLDQEVKLSIGLNGLLTDDGSVPLSGFGFDSSAAAGVDNIFKGNRSGWGVDSQLQVGRFGLYAELLGSHFRPDQGNFTATTLDDSFDSLGWYVMGAFDIVPAKLQAIVKFESFDPNTSISGNSSDVWTIGLNYYIKGDDIKLMLNYLHGNSAGAPDDQGRLITRVQLAF
jgi:phosphate-selective porin OprO/OprP